MRPRDNPYELHYPFYQWLFLLYLIFNNLLEIRRSRAFALLPQALGQAVHQLHFDVEIDGKVRVRMRRIDRPSTKSRCPWLPQTAAARSATRRPSRRPFAEERVIRLDNGERHQVNVFLHSLIGQTAADQALDGVQRVFRVSYRLAWPARQPESRRYPDTR